MARLPDVLRHRVARYRWVEAGDSPDRTRRLELRRDGKCRVPVVRRRGGCRSTTSFTRPQAAATTPPTWSLRPRSPPPSPRATRDHWQRRWPGRARLHGRRRSGDRPCGTPDETNRRHRRRPVRINIHSANACSTGRAAVSGPSTPSRGSWARRRRRGRRSQRPHVYTWRGGVLERRDDPRRMRAEAFGTRLYDESGGTDRAVRALQPRVGRRS